MTTRCLLPLLLVLLQSGLAAGHAHFHADPVGHVGVPHFHAHDLLALFAAGHDQRDHDGDDHDADAVDLSDLTVAPAPPPAPDADALDLAHAGRSPAFAGFSGLSSFPLGLPPSTAAPRPPLYITLCSLTI